MNLMLNLKSCTPSEVQLSDGMYQVLGYTKGACGYKVTYKEENAQMECKFPTPVAQMYGYEAINATKTGVESSFVKNMNSSLLHLNNHLLYRQIVQLCINNQR